MFNKKAINLLENNNDTMEIFVIIQLFVHQQWAEMKSQKDFCLQG